MLNGSSGSENTDTGTTSTIHRRISPKGVDSAVAQSLKANVLSRQLVVLAFALLALTSWFSESSLLAYPRSPPLGAEGGPVGRREAFDGFALTKRQDTQTDVCKRWSQQTAIVNGTLFSFGGRATTTSSQSSNTWNNDFFSLDLKSSWQIGSPPMRGLPRPSGPPAVSNGYLWNSFDSLFLYGGELSDSPNVAPPPFSLWEYHINEERWEEHADPRTSAGENAAPAGLPVERSAEGAGVNVPELGRGFYFGGHLDDHTTAGWSNQIARVYLKSLLEFTFPGYSNPGLQDEQTAGGAGLWRNITEGGLQDSAGFTERADGILVYVPGFGNEGILLGLAGGTANTFTQMNVIDVYDIATSTWYKQSTSGPSPEYRVNPCATVAAAADGSSFNIYMFGGQNLIPAGQQVQRDDMWILSVPSFTWIEVPAEAQSVPPARAGHTCNIWDASMIVTGGYVGQDLSCDSPGIYVYDLSSLTWVNQFTALSRHDSDDSGDAANSGNGNDKSDGSVAESNNILSQQQSQQGDMSGLQGSYGYQVPELVRSVIGGGPTGGATLTAPVATATAGPLATGRPVTYTVTGSGLTSTSTTVSNSGNGGSGGGSLGSDGGPNIGAIVAGVIAGLLAILAGYLGFCAYIYRKQLNLYKNHIEMAQRAGSEKGLFGAYATPRSQNSSDSPYGSSNIGSSYGQSNGQSGLKNGIQPFGVEDGSGNGGTGSRRSSTQELLSGQEPSFFGVMLHPRRSLKVINRD